MFERAFGLDTVAIRRDSDKIAKLAATSDGSGSERRSATEMPS